MADSARGYDAIGRVMARWADAVRRRAVWVTITGAVATVGLGWYAVTHLGIDTDTADMLSEDLPWRRDDIEFTRAFPEYADEILVVIDGATPELADRARRRLADSLRVRTHLFKSVYLPGGGRFFARNGLLYKSARDLEDLRDRLDAVEPLLEQLSEDPSLPGFFDVLGDGMQAVRYGADVDLVPMLAGVRDALAASRAGRFYELSWEEVVVGGPTSLTSRRRFILAQPEMDFSKLLPGDDAVRTIREVGRRLKLDRAHGVRLRITGSVPMADDELRSVQKGAGLAGILALISVSIILYLGLRSLRLMAASLLTLGSGLIGTAAFAAAAVGHLNLISVAFAVLYIGLGIDYAIHMCLRYRELIVAGTGQQEALHLAANDVGSSLLLSAVTTAAAFFSFFPTAYKGMSELGLITGTGMFISLLATMTLLPALLTLMPLAPCTESIERDPTSLRIARVANRHGRIVAVAALVLGVVAVGLLPRVRFDYDPLNLRDPNSESVATYRELLSSRDESPLTISVVAPDDSAARLLSRRLATLASVDKTVLLDDFVPDGQKARLETIAEIRASLDSLAPFPDSTRHVGPVRGARAVSELRTSLARFRPHADERHTAAATRLLEEVRRWRHAYRLRSADRRAEMVRALETSLLLALPQEMTSLRMALSAAPVRRADLPGQLVERWVSPEGSYRVEVRPRENLSDATALRRFVEQVRTVAPSATGAPVLSLEAGDAVVGAFRTAMLWALAATFVVLLLLLRSPIATVMVLIPLLLAGVLTGAASVLLDLPFNFANVIALPLLLGVGVDSGIHMVHRFRTLPGEDGNLLATSTARAVLFSLLTTIFSFGNLAVSPHRGMASMGKLLTIGMALTLFCTLMVLPRLLRRSVVVLAPSQKPT